MAVSGLFPEKPGSAFDSWGISVVYYSLSVMRGWDGAHAAVRSAEFLTNPRTDKQHFCHRDRFGEIANVQSENHRGVAWMMLLHDVLHVLACTSFPNKKIVNARSRCSDVMLFFRRMRHIPFKDNKSELNLILIRPSRRPYSQVAPHIPMIQAACLIAKRLGSTRRL